MKDKTLLTIIILACVGYGGLSIANSYSIDTQQATISELQSEQVYQRQILDKSEAYIQDLITYGDCHLCHDPIIRTINYKRGE